MMLDMLAAVAREDTTIGANGRRRDRLKPRLKASARAIQQTPTATRASKARSRPAFPGPRLTQKRPLVSLLPRAKVGPENASVNSPAPQSGIEQDDLPLFGVARQPLVFLAILEQMIR